MWLDLFYKVRQKWQFKKRSGLREKFVNEAEEEEE